MGAAALVERAERVYATWPARVGPCVVAGAAAASCTLLRLVDPGEPGVYPPCPFRALTGLHCPGCGTLRGLHRLLSGDPVAALGANALMVLALPYLVWSYLAWALPAFGRRSPRRPQPSARATSGLLVAVLAFWVARNIPLWPLAALAP